MNRQRVTLFELGLDAIAERLVIRSGHCRHCGIHSVGQCQQPKNWTASEPARHAEYAIMQANETGSEAEYNRQLEREARREFVRSIKP